MKFDVSTDAKKLSSSMKISFLSGADSSSTNVNESQRKSYPSNFLFDFSNTDMNDLASDQCEFNDFYKNEGS